MYNEIVGRMWYLKREAEEHGIHVNAKIAEFQVSEVNAAVLRYGLEDVTRFKPSKAFAHPEVRLDTAFGIPVKVVSGESDQVKLVVEFVG